MFNEKFEQHYYGLYRGKIEQIDQTNMNGVYYTRVYPFMADESNIPTTSLPKAVSILTNRYQHVQLLVGDWVHVQFDNGNLHYPVIVGLCNIKNTYPTPSQAMGSAYGTYDKIALGQNMTLEVDENTGTTVLTVGASGAQTTFKVGNLIKMATASANLKSILNDMLTVLQNLVTPGTLISSPSGGPVVYATAVTDIQKIVTDIANLSLLLE